MKGKRLRSSAIDKHQPRCQHLTSSTKSAQKRTLKTLERRAADVPNCQAVAAYFVLPEFRRLTPVKNGFEMLSGERKAG